MSNFAEVKTAELIGAMLDWAVAQVEGVKVTVNGEFPEKVFIGDKKGLIKNFYKPSADWSRCGPLIQDFSIEFEYVQDLFTIRAESLMHNGVGWGPSHLIAACRAIVASVLGETVSVPRELV